MRQRLLLIGGMGVLTVAALAGWLRRPAPAAAGYNATTPTAGAYCPTPSGTSTATTNVPVDAYGQPQYADRYAQQPQYVNNGQPQYADRYGQPQPQYANPGAPVGYAQGAYAYPANSYSYSRVEPAAPRTAYYYEQPAPRYRRVVQREYVTNERVYRVRRHHRPLSHSLAIVGGSAGVGAAIGGIAGGGKGAGIGALAGGAGGFIYDRLTRNR